MKNKSLESKLTKYSAAAGAVLAGAAGASASIHYTDLDITINAGNNSAWLDLDGNGTNDTQFRWSSRQGMSTTFTNNADLYRNAPIGFAGSADNAYRFTFGQLISINPRSASSESSFVAGWNAQAVFTAVGYGYSSSSYSGIPLHITYWGMDVGEFAAGQTGYMAFRFNEDDTWKFGWIEIDAIGDLGESYHINGYAFEDSGAPIAAGAVPEPSSLALLALGAAGIRAIRRFNRPGT